MHEKKEKTKQLNKGRFGNRRCPKGSNPTPRTLKEPIGFSYAPLYFARFRGKQGSFLWLICNMDLIFIIYF